MIKKTVGSTGKMKMTIIEFARETGVPPDRLLSQLQDAGISVASVDDAVSEEQKQKFLRYLQLRHGAKAENQADKIVLQRAKTSEIKLGGSHGAGKTVSVQVRKKRTYVKQRPAADEASQAAPARDDSSSVAADTHTTSATAPLIDVAGLVGEQSIALVGAAATLTQEVEKSADTANADAVVAMPHGVSAPEAPTTTSPENTVLSATQTTEAAAAQTTAEEKLGAKRKEKGKELLPTEVNDQAERSKKRKKSRNTSTGSSDRNYEALLARGTDLSRVFKQEDDEFLLGGARRGGKRAPHPKIKIEAFNKPTGPLVREVEIPEVIQLGELSQRMSVKAAEVIKTLMKLGMMATINQALDQDTAVLVAETLGHKVKLVRSDAIEHALAQSLLTDTEQLPRPPVITIMGHVDHGKTTLLDYIRTTKVAASEAGGITQHIGAYHVDTPKGTLTFLDTPGHAAFTAMRARGAKLTDIVVLVVAADDGVMPQTIEAIEHAKAASVPIVVAVNKMDKHGVDPDRIKTELSKHGLIPEEWGGDTMFVPISAKTGLGIDTLLDSIAVQAEVLELKAPRDCSAKGVVIESRLERGRGPVMSVLVQQGTLQKGDIVLAGLEYGRIRALFDEAGRAVVEAGPSIPVEILGMSGVPQAGDDFLVVADEKQAREVAAFRQTKHREARLAKAAPKLEDFLQRIEEKASVTLNIVLKADVLGSVEALKHALTELSNVEVKVNILSSGIGGINESDVNLAIASGAIMIAFNVRANQEARKLIEAGGVDVHYYNIIYDVIDQVKKAISGVLAPEIQERVVGLAVVREVFRSSKTGAIAGCMVLEGSVKRNFPIRVLRDNVVVFEGALESLRRFKEDASEVRAGMECGIAVKNYNDVKVGDQIEVYEKISVKREI